MKIAIFIDGGYIDKVLQNEFQVRIDYAKLPEVVSHGKELLRTYYYNCLPYQSNPPTEDEKARFSKAQRFHKMLTRLPKYEIRLGRLARRGDDYEQKGIDTLLSIDLVNLAATKQISDAILIAGDYDYVPAIKVVKEHAVNVTLYHSRIRGNYHDLLWEICDDRVPISQDFINKIKRESPIL